MRLRLTSLLPIPAAELAEALTRTELLNVLDAPVLVFVPISPPLLPERWEPGAYRMRLLVGGRLGIGEHTLDVQLVGSEPGGVVWHDAGYSDLIRVWDHQIELDDRYGMTRYADVVEIHAGPLTLPAWLFARALYGNRQRKLSAWVKTRR